MTNNMNDQVNKLIYTLWAYRKAFKAPLGKSPHKLVYGHPCHSSFDIKHQAWQAIRTLNYDLNVIGKEMKLSLNEVGENRREPYETICRVRCNGPIIIM